MTEKHTCDCNQGRLACRCKEPAPAPPPMRGGRQQHFDIEGVAVFIILSMAFGIFCGWQMHGGICS